MNEEVIKSIHTITKAVRDISLQLDSVVDVNHLTALFNALVKLELALIDESKIVMVDREYPLTCKEAMTLAFNEDKKVASDRHPGILCYFDKNKSLCYNSGYGEVCNAHLIDEERKAHWRVVE